MGGAGGSINGEQCPDTAPEPDADCTGLEGETCTYEETGCWCRQFGMDAGTWQCSDMAGQCPNNQPATGSCTGGQTCNYSGGTGFCFCPQAGPNADTWSCPGQ